jgi:hypothetical protein
LVLSQNFTEAGTVAGTDLHIMGMLLARFSVKFASHSRSSVSSNKDLTVDVAFHKMDSETSTASPPPSSRRNGKRRTMTRMKKRKRKMKNNCAAFPYLTRRVIL